MRAMRCDWRTAGRSFVVVMILGSIATRAEAECLPPLYDPPESTPEHTHLRFESPCLAYGLWAGTLGLSVAGLVAERRLISKWEEAEDFTQARARESDLGLSTWLGTNTYFVEHRQEWAAPLSDALVAFPLALEAVATATMRGDEFIAWTTALGANAGVNQFAKTLFRQPRPVAYVDLSRLDEDTLAAAEVHLSEGDVRSSFYSGHTSNAAAGAFAFASILYQRQAAGIAWWYGGAAALTAGVGSLRVVAGQHHVADVVVGGLIGAGFGTSIPLLLLRQAPKRETASSGLRINMILPSDRGVSISGSF